MGISLGRKLGCIFPEAWPKWANHSHQLDNGRGDVSRDMSKKAALTVAGNWEQWEFGQPGWSQNGGTPGNDKKQTEQRGNGGSVGSGEREEYRAGADGGDRAMEEEQGLGGPTQETARENTMETLKNRVPTGIKTTA